MSNSYINWYSLDKDLQTCEHPPVDLDRALEIVNDYYAKGARTFESAEEAVSATMFGFSRSALEFIEFSVNGPSQISYKFELSDPNVSFLRKMFGGTFQFETMLQSKMEMVQRTQEFFDLRSEE